MKKFSINFFFLKKKLIFSSEQHNIFWSFDDCRGEWRDRWRRKNGGNSSVLVPFSSISLPISLNALLVDKNYRFYKRTSYSLKSTWCFLWRKGEKTDILSSSPFSSILFCVHAWLAYKISFRRKKWRKKSIVYSIYKLCPSLELNWTEHQLWRVYTYIHITCIGIVGEGEFGGRDFISWLYMKKVVESGRQRQHQSFSQKVKWKSKALKKVSKS